MIIKLRLITSFLFLSCLATSQRVSGVYKIGDLLTRIDRPDTIYVINFWATWCKPCVVELPSIDSLSVQFRNSNVRVILVSLDFKEDLDKKVNPFLKKHHLLSENILLDEVNGNDFINKISKDWSGAIPATFFKKDKKQLLIEKKMLLKDLQVYLSGLDKK